MTEETATSTAATPINRRREARNNAGYAGLVGMKRLSKVTKIAVPTLYGYEAGSFVPLCIARRLCKVLSCPLIVYQFKHRKESRLDIGSGTPRVSGGNQIALTTK